MFSKAQVASEEIDNDPCNWTRDMWSEWRSHNYISLASSRSGKEIVFLKRLKMEKRNREEFEHLQLLEEKAK